MKIYCFIKIVKLYFLLIWFYFLNVELVGKDRLREFLILIFNISVFFVFFVIISIYVVFYVYEVFLKNFMKEGGLVLF